MVHLRSRRFSLKEERFVFAYSINKCGAQSVYAHACVLDAIEWATSQLARFYPIDMLLTLDYCIRNNSDVKCNEECTPTHVLRTGALVNLDVVDIARAIYSYAPVDASECRLHIGVRIGGHDDGCDTRLE